MFMEPRNRFRMRDGLVSLLAGNTQGGLKRRLPVLAFKSAYHALSLAYRFGYRLQERPAGAGAGRGGRPLDAAMASILPRQLSARRVEARYRVVRPLRPWLRALEAAARSDPARRAGAGPAGALRQRGRPRLRPRPARRGPARGGSRGQAHRPRLGRAAARRGAHGRRRARGTVPSRPTCARPPSRRPTRSCSSTSSI